MGVLDSVKEADLVVGTGPDSACVPVFVQGFLVARAVPDAVMDGPELALEDLDVDVDLDSVAAVEPADEFLEVFAVLGVQMQDMEQGLVQSSAYTDMDKKW